MSRSPSRSSVSLEPPRKSVELIDDGAHDLHSETEDEHFSDASEGRRISSRPVTPSSPIPRTRVEKVDNSPSHGEVPGTPAYQKRTQDAIPDEVEIIPEGRLSKRSSQYLEPARTPTTPGGSVIPRTVVEKVDPSSPSYGEVPGTQAYEKRLADATPDQVYKSSESGTRLDYGDSASSNVPILKIPVPETVITPVDSMATPGNKGQGRRVLDASPEFVDNSSEVPRSPSWEKPMQIFRRTSTSSSIDDDERDDNEADDFGDDFDEFEEGGEADADDDFGEFDEGFNEPVAETQREAVFSHEPSNNLSAFPLIDFETLSSVHELQPAIQLHLDTMFPSTTADKFVSLPEIERIPDESPIFPSDRSRSLWKQLITPPPLQPPNWTQSRIRRLFLVSMGVPVDLDEILPPSKQKKLVLPDINLEPSPRKSESDKAPVGSVARLKSQKANDSTGSVDSTQSGTNARSNRGRRSKAPPPPPELDLVAVKRLCATTDEKLDGFTDEELQAHVRELQLMTEKTAALLEYWLKRRDGLRKEKEAFEGVIENLVRHARRVRM